MFLEEFSNLFDVLFNNITSNQAPGLNEYEKSVFLTKAQDEIVKNHFSAQSKGNLLQQGFDDSAKRQADFSTIMKTGSCVRVTGGSKLNPHSTLWRFPDDLYIVVNEELTTDATKQLQVIPLRYDEYTRLMSKPFKRPLKNQAWRINNSGEPGRKYVEIITNVGDTVKGYVIRYVRQLKPIILADLDGLTIGGLSEPTECELDPILHEDILQRAVELAKVSWVAAGSAENMQVVTQAGQRSE